MTEITEKRDPVTLNDQVVRCPDDDGPDGASDVIGCGSTNIKGPDKEGLYDCLDCGIWFDQTEALSYLERKGAFQESGKPE